MSNPIRVVPGGTVNIDVSSSSQAVKVTEARTCSIKITNAGTAPAWIRSGDSTVTATTTACDPILAGQVEVQTFSSADGSPIYIAAIAAASTGKIYFSPGDSGI